ncbi:hypothetical protein BN59_01917 [Legionella massiliensis]|uniref:SynChlorMet cassette protein ScmC n=1 Tax=Legionella massiliensis TaxID=1034943 RepID=A0A078L0S6_9GAMM|nr:hypothetical protein [Legionella massiliensis]CDZ77633.1 hypothetical protein BN59_01917 [Legionella massiliensis]CEE13371.1 hypothetical protein BN1094_01917 [Legionella massiliensis]
MMRATAAETNFHFQAYGLIINSVLSPLGDALTPSSKSSADLAISYAEISPQGLDKPIEKGLFYQVNSNQLWLNIPDIGRFLVSNGESIHIDPCAAVADSSLAVFVYGPCLAALLMQRNLLVLKGSVIQIADYALAYIGPSASGKSLALARMMNRGAKFLADGLCVVSEEGCALPGLAQLHLGYTAADYLQLNRDELKPIRPKVQKFSLPAEKAFLDKPLPLKTIWVLNSQKQGELSYRDLAGGEKISYLQKNSYSRAYLNGFAKTKLYFHYHANLASQAKMSLIEYSQLQDFIELVDRQLA